MGEPPKACLNAADDNRDVRIEAVEHVGVDDGGPVRAGRLSSGGVCVVTPLSKRRRVGVNHGVDCSGNDGEEEVWFAELSKAFAGAVFPVRLADDGNAVSCFY